MKKNVIYRNYNTKKIIETTLIIFGIFLTLQITFKTSMTLKPWADEIIALTSNISFFRSLDFLPSTSYNNFSYALTSGILSSVGGVFGWVLTKNFIIARVSNFIYVFFVQLCMSFYIFKNNEKYKFNYFVFFSLTQFLLIPWWFSSLYFIAEVISTLIFVNSLFLYNKNPKVSVFLMGCSVIFGKFLMLIPTVLFLISKIKIKEIKKNLIQLLFYLLPFCFWYLLIYIKIGEGGFYIYLNEFFGTLFVREDSGVQSAFNLTYNTFIYNLNNSEVASWTTASLLRAAFSPILFLIIYFQNRDYLEDKLNVSFVSVFVGISGTYLWFWILSPPKFIRQSTHFVLLVIFVSLYIFLYTDLKNKYYKFLILFNLSLFFSDLRLILAFNLFTGIYYFILNEKIKNLFDIKLFFVVFLVLNLLNINFEVNSKDTFNLDLPSCSQDIFSKKCVDDYLFSLYE